MCVVAVREAGMLLLIGQPFNVYIQVTRAIEDNVTGSSESHEATDARLDLNKHPPRLYALLLLVFITAEVINGYSFLLVY